jgi:RNA polymerase sigma factor (sigma-70 family)
MATESFYGPTGQQADYAKLFDEYRACEIKCQASLDQLRAAERELRASAPKFEHAVDRGAPAEVERALRQISNRNRALDTTALDNLSHRERSVFELIGQGLATAAIAESLNISTSTVETYRERLKMKLQLDTGLELTRFAILWYAGK